MTDEKIGKYKVITKSEKAFLVENFETEKPWEIWKVDKKGNILSKYYFSSLNKAKRKYASCTAAFAENKPLKVKVSITLDGDMVDKLRIIAEDSDRALSQYINLVLRKHLSDINY